MVNSACSILVLGPFKGQHFFIDVSKSKVV